MYFVKEATSTLLATANTDNCKLLMNSFLYRGLESETESRTAFQNVGSIGDKNVYRIFAGGNHSWIVIDDIIPQRNMYRPPSPVPNFTSVLMLKDPKAKNQHQYK